LADVGFVAVCDENNNDITHKITSIGDPSDHSFGRGYKVADYLKGKENSLSVLLTPSFGQLQETLGFSLSDLVKSLSYEALLMRPIFGKPDAQPSADVFVLMPFAKEYAPVFDDHITNVCQRLKLDCRRADNIFASRDIMSDIWALIYNSSIIIADCTGRNPNVFYELGIAHTIGKNVVIITQNADDIPFDIRQIRYIEYKYTPRGMKAFEENLARFLSAQKSDGRSEDI
jgi:hypothetical protein